MTSLKNIAMVGAAIAALTGCAQSQKNIDVASGDLREIKLREKQRYLELPIASSGFMSVKEQTSLKHFSSDFRDDGKGLLVVTVPQGAAGGYQAEREILDLLLREGVLEEDVVFGEYAAGGTVDAPVIIAFTAYEAYVPGCSTVNEHDWANMTSNVSLPSFGCAVQENLAQMLAYPTDVLGQRELDPSDGSRQGRLLDLYRSGGSTISSQTADGSSGG